MNPAIDLTGWVGGSLGTTLLVALAYIGKLLADRLIPSRSDRRDANALALDAMNSALKILGTDKEKDSEKLDKAERELADERRNGRAASDDWAEREGKYRAEIADLKERIEVKDRQIKQLVHYLRQLGAQITGLDIDQLAEIEITLPAATVREQVARSQ